MKEALLRVDVQNDFCPGGKLGVPDGDGVVHLLSLAAMCTERMGGLTVDSMDWHPEKTPHFEVWPPHCIQGTPGAEIHQHLYIPERRVLIRKGMGTEHGYSPFEGVTDDGRSLLQTLEDESVDDLYVGGLTTEYCVKNAVLDARRFGFRVIVLSDAIRPVIPGPETEGRALEEMLDHGAIFMETRAAYQLWK